MQISPRFKASDWKSLDLSQDSGWKKAVVILNDRVSGRFFRMVERIEDVEFSGFATLALDCLLIETLQQFREGVDETPRRQGKRYFERFLTETSFRNHFDTTTAGMFYEQFRRGILHQAEIKESSKVWKVGKLVRMTPDGRGLVVNHKKFHAELRRVFADYLRQLRAGSDRNLRENFKNKMDFICQA